MCVYVCVCFVLREAKIDAEKLCKEKESAEKRAALQRSKIMTSGDASKKAGKMSIKHGASTDPTADGGLFTYKSQSAEHRICLAKMPELVAGSVDLTKPFLMDSEELKTEFPCLFDEASPLRPATTDALRMFQSSAERAHPSKHRGKVDMENKDLAAEIVACIGRVFRGYTKLSPPDHEAGLRLAKLMQPDLFLFTAQKPQINCEAASLASVRINVAGSRTIMCWPFSQLGDYVRSKIGGRALKHPINSVATTQWIAAATTEDIKELVEQSPRMPFYLGTVGPRDLLFTPVGWVKAELPQADDNIMIRASVLIEDPSGTDAQEMAVALADYKVTNKRNVALEIAHTIVTDRAKVLICIHDCFKLF